MARTRYRSVVTITVGVLVLLIPVVVTHLNNIEQHERAQRYSDSVAQIDDAERRAALQAARDYNAQLDQRTLPDPWLHRPDVESEAYRHYLSLLHTDETMARIRIPTVGIDLPVHHGTSERVLANGVGHLYGSALPVGGPGTHAVLTGHSGLASFTMFDNLTHLHVDDLFEIDVLGERLAYRVDRVVTVLPDQVDAIRPVPGEDHVTLITCTPYGINSHRLLVRGVRVDVPLADLPRTYHSPWQPWMIGVIVVAAASVVYVVWWIVRRRREHAGQVPAERQEARS